MVAGELGEVVGPVLNFGAAVLVADTVITLGVRAAVGVTRAGVTGLTLVAVLSVKMTLFSHAARPSDHVCSKFEP